MLEGLDDINWASRRAEELPKYIRNLASHDPLERSHAYAHISDKILYGGVNFENVDLGYDISEVLKTDVQYLLTLFVIELLGYKEVEQKEEILYILRFLAEYTKFRYEGDIFQERAEQIRRAVWNGRDLYFSLLNGADTLMRLEAFDLLAMFNEYIGEIFSPLIAKLQAEEKDRSKATMLRALRERWIQKGVLSDTNLQSLTNILRSILTSDCDDDLRGNATLLWIDLLHYDAPPEAISFVTTAMIQRKDPERPVFPPTVLSHEYEKSLLKLGLEKGLPAAIKVIKETQYVENGYRAVAAALVLAFKPEATPSIFEAGIGAPANVIFFVFPRDYKFRPDLKALNPLQKSVIEAIVSADLLWTIQCNLLELFGLPTTREGLKNLLLPAQPA